MTTTYTFDWFSNNIGFLQKNLGAMAGRADLRMLEIGCFEGLSTNWFLANIVTGPRAFITCVDTFGGSAEHAGIDLDDLYLRFLGNTEHAAGRMSVFRGRSDEYCASHARDYYDVIYVDGSHTVEDILLDALLAWRLLKPGGIMIFDDYGWGGHLAEGLRPKAAIDAFVAAYAPRLTVLDHDYQYAVTKLS